MAIVYPVVNCKMDYINSQTYNTYATLCCLLCVALIFPMHYIAMDACFIVLNYGKDCITSTCNWQIPSLEMVY